MRVTLVGNVAISRKLTKHEREIHDETIADLMIYVADDIAISLGIPPPV